MTFTARIDSRRIIHAGRRMARAELMRKPHTHRSMASAELGMKNDSILPRGSINRGNSTC